MIIEQLLQSAAPHRFVEDYYLRLPFALPGGASEFIPLGTWHILETLCDHAGADLILARSGQRAEPDPDQTPARVRLRYRDGYTVLVRHGERHHAGLNELARRFEHDFHASADVHLYATPAGQYGFGWHYDAEDVFLLQTEGRKEYRLRKNTVNPWPVAQAMPADMWYERELMPLVKCTLEPGDWLYIPHGYWHYGTALTDSITIAVGLMAPTGVDVFDTLRDGILASIRWRQRLPGTGPAAGLTVEEARREYHERLCELADELSLLLKSPGFAQGLVEDRIERFADSSLGTTPGTHEESAGDGHNQHGGGNRRHDDRGRSL